MNEIKENEMSGKPATVALSRKDTFPMPIVIN